MLAERPLPTDLEQRIAGLARAVLPPDTAEISVRYGELGQEDATRTRPGRRAALGGARP
jgi:hypothetical protein